MNTATPRLPAGVGARFVRADLQIHTPVDKRFKLPAGTDIVSEIGRQRIGKLYVESAERLGLSVLGITEHNDLTYFPYIRDAAVGTDIVVFPGVEFTISPGLHLIALFEPTVDPAVVLDCIVKMGLGTKEDARFHGDGSPKQATKSLREAVDLVDGAGGILIAPHVCGKSGLLNLPEGQHRVESWKEAKILAADPGSGRMVATLGAFERGAFENTHDIYRREHPIATVWTSDARSVDELGRHSTWLKLGTPTIEGLRQAFLDPESRVRHPNDYVGTKYPRLVGVQWEGAGFLAGEEIHFNSNLNCLIGGKGAGKSAVIETLRFAFGIEPAAEFKDQCRSLIKAVLPAGGTVRVVLESGEPKARYTVERLAGGYAPVVRDGSGEILPDVEPSHLQLPSIYGQKEIYGIAQKGSDQLAVLDGFVGDAIQRLNTEEGELVKELSRNAGALDRLHDDLESIDERLSELPKLQEMKKRYEALGIAEKLQKKTGLSASLDRLKRAERKLLTFAETAKQQATATKLLSEYGQLAATEPLKELLDEARALVEGTSADWRTAALRVGTAAAARATRVGELVKAAKGEVQQEDEACQTIITELAAAYPDVELEVYLRIEEQIADLVPLKAERSEHASGEKQLLTKRAALLEGLRRVRAERFKRRLEAAQSITQRLKDILRVKVAFQGGVESVRGYLDSLKTGVHKKALDALVAHPDFSVPAFVAALDQGASLVDVFDVSDANAKRIADVIDRTARFELETFDLPDAISIEFNVASKGEPQYKQLGSLSVGQKSTAILLLLLLKDDHPFVVDQPEDDLDNRFIYEDVVTRLRASKEQRQFVIATHNANIPVLGDAEQIVVLGASSDFTTVECCGSIDDPAVQQSVKHILEGGQKAFEMRRKKYGF